MAIIKNYDAIVYIHLFSKVKILDLDSMKFFEVNLN